ncbi:hypothetical protein D3C84_422620 [compost metagenome]
MLALVDFTQHRTQFRQRHRAAEQVALDEITAVALEKLVLLKGFDAFGDHLQMQGVSHDDNRLNDFHVLSRLGNVLDERAIDLQRVERQALEVGEGGITGAEFVDRQRHAEGADLAQQHQRIGDVDHQRVLGHFQFQSLRRHSGNPQRVFDFIGEVFARQVQRRAVDGDVQFFVALT